MRITRQESNEKFRQTFARRHRIMNELKRYTLYIQNITDIISIIFSFGASYVLWFWVLPGRENGFTTIQPELYQQYLLLILLGYVVMNILFLYGDDTFLKRSALSEFAEVAKITGYIFVFMILYIFFRKLGDQFSRFFWILFAVIFLFTDYSLRMLAKKILIPRISEGGFSEKLLLIGSEQEVSRFLEEYRNSKEWRYQIAGIVISDRDEKGRKIDSIPVLGNLSTLEEDIDPNDADTILITAGTMERDREGALLKRFRSMGKKIQVEINKHGIEEDAFKLDQIGSIPILSFEMNPVSKRSQLFRRFFEVVICLALIVPFALLFILYALLLRIESPGGTIISRPCIGKHGRRYNRFRFRTFHGNAEERLKEGRSPYTVSGSVLRFLHLDGMPQIVNVLFDEIGFVGPIQHEITDFVNMSEQDKKLLMFRPGIIGPWMENVRELFGESSASFFAGWSIGKDIWIILVSIGLFLIGKSSRNKEAWYQEAETKSMREFAELLCPYPIPVPYPNTSGFFYRLIKRVFDIIVSLAAIVLLLPLMIILSVIVAIEDGGLPFYTQKRLGYQGRWIYIYKFRSMRTDAGNLDKYFTPEQKEQYLREFKLKGDPRITRIGKFLRVSSLDELPQLFNILAGDLSLVGPRPIVESETRYYGDEIGKFLSVPPGLTGYWQAYERNNATYESGRRSTMELYYVDHKGILMDLKILFRTFGRVLSHDGAV